MVDHLEQLLLGPGRSAVRSEVVQDEHRHSLHLLEELIVGQLGVLAVRPAYLIEEIRNEREENRVPLLHEAVRNSGSEMRLADAMASQERQRAARLLREPQGRRMRSLVARRCLCARARPLRVDSLEPHVAQNTQVAESLQPRQPLATRSHPAGKRTGTHVRNQHRRQADRAAPTPVPGRRNTPRRQAERQAGLPNQERRCLRYSAAVTFSGCRPGSPLGFAPFPWRFQRSNALSADRQLNVLFVAAWRIASSIHSAGNSSSAERKLVGDHRCQHTDVRLVQLIHVRTLRPHSLVAAAPALPRASQERARSPWFATSASLTPR